MELPPCLYGPGHQRREPIAAGIQKLLEEARADKFDIVVAEALDRLARDQEDVAALYKQFGFRDVKLVTLSEGEINELHIGLKGAMNAPYLKDLADKIRRGQRGRIGQGLAAGSLPYGYDVVREFAPDGQPVRGKRRINKVQAPVIRRIFGLYAACISARSIAAELNREAVPSPRGGQ